MAEQLTLPGLEPAAEIKRNATEVVRKINDATVMLMGIDLTQDEDQRKAKDYIDSIFCDVVLELAEWPEAIPEPGTRFLTMLYFFAVTGIDPRAKGKLTEAQRGTLREIYTRLNTFAACTGAGEDLSQLQAKLQMFYAFIDREHPAPETAESMARQLVVIEGIAPLNHIMPNNPLMNDLQHRSPINAGAYDMVVRNAEAAARRKEITNYTIITLDPDESGITMQGGRLTEYERQVSDAVISIWAHADKEKIPPIFSAETVARAMPGGTNRSKISQGQKSSITKAIEKFRRLHIHVNATDEFIQRGIIKKDGKVIFDDYYLSAAHGECITKKGAHPVHAWKLHAEPLILTYARMTGQLLTVSGKCIAIEEVVNGEATGAQVKMSDTRQAIVGYLIRRICVIKRDAEKHRAALARQARYKKAPPVKKKAPIDTILFETIFKDVGVAPTKQHALRLRQFVFDTLDYEKAIGFIAGYEVQKAAAGEITGVKILC